MATIKRKIIRRGMACVILSTAICANMLGAQIYDSANAGKVESKILEKPDRNNPGRTESTRMEVLPETFFDRSVTVSDIKELTRRSTGIIVGRLIAVESLYDEKTNEVNTKHLVHVQSLLKGNIKNGSTIELEMEGGAYNRDGTIISRRAADTRGVKADVSYFIFMRESESKDRDIATYPVYRLSLGMQGMFEIVPETYTLLPLNTAKINPLVNKYENMSVLDFMNELLTAIAGEVSLRR